MRSGITGHHRVKYTTGAESSEREERNGSVKGVKRIDSSTRITIPRYVAGVLCDGTEC